MSAQCFHSLFKSENYCRKYAILINYQTSEKKFKKNKSPKIYPGILGWADSRKFATGNSGGPFAGSMLEIQLRHYYT